MINVKAWLDNAILLAEVQDLLPGMKVEEFRIKRYGSTVHTAKVDLNRYSFTLTAEGVYVVAAVILYNGTKLTRYSFPVGYFMEETRASFDECCTRWDASESEDLPLYEMKYPFSYTAVVYCKQAKKEIEERLKSIDNQLIVDKIIIKEKTYFILSNKGLRNGKVVFSGMAKYKGRFIFGVDDFTEKDEIGELKESIGNFSAINIGDGQIEIFNDFFGECKTYYFEDNNLFVAANQYHLLVLILKELGISLRINKELVKATLCCNHYMFAQQVFTTQALIGGIKFLEPYEWIRLTEQAEILTTSFKDYVAIAPKPLDKNEYRSLLESAKEEIVENLSIVFENPNIDQTVIDITAGLDSRMVFAALTNIKDFDQKVTVRTLNIAEDLRIAAGLVNAYDLTVDETPAYTPDFNTVMAEKQSAFLGGSYKTYPIRNEKYYEPGSTTVRFSGGYGEQMTRYYLTKDMVTDPLFEQEPDYVTAFMKDIASSSVSYITDYDSGVRYAEKYLKAEIEQYPCVEKLDKVEFHFLNFRGPFHFKQFSVIGNVWMPLQSKNLYKLFRYTQRKAELYKLALQVACYFNTPVGTSEYGDENYNEALRQLRGQLILPEEKYRRYSPEMNRSLTKYEQATEKKNKKSKEIPVSLKSGESSNLLYNNFTENITKEALHLLLGLAQDKNYTEIAFQLWYFITSVEANRERYIIWIWTRLKAIIQQLYYAGESPKNKV